jgi:aminoglycoside phosphotransferase (APT) family kinase protein
VIAHLVDAGRLAAFLDERGLGAGEVQVERIPQGHSNLTFTVRRGDETWILRRPPRGELLPTSHDVTREYRIMTALWGGPVPVPRPIVLNEDPEVIGAPFYLMQRVEGVAIRGELPPAYAADEDARLGLAERLIDVLAEIHQVDWNAIGLGNLGKPAGYIERQVRRWTGQLMGAWNREIPELSEVANWLQEHIPESPPPTLVHGDYRLDNLMVLPEPPARVTAVVDWEMGTIGDPLADLGYLLTFWRDPGDPPAEFADDAWTISEMPGFPRRQWLVERYRERTGIDVRALDFYQVLAIWKLAILLEGSYKRLKDGMADDPWFERLETGVPALARRALELTRAA